MSSRGTRFLQKVFSEVPATYELTNHVLTLGLDIAWRRHAARMIAQTVGGERWVDVCTGTGEMAAYLSHLAPRGTKVYGVDFSPAMLQYAQRKPEADRIEFLRSNVRTLAFADNSVDLITISFATRNINLNRDALVRTFAEFCRVLKPGGRFVNLETSRPSFSPVRKAFDLYTRLAVYPVGSRISGSKVGYRYLSRTIPRFYPPEELAALMERAGFIDVTFKRLLLGVAAIHQGTKG